jgi:hypothetical protein
MRIYPLRSPLRKLPGRRLAAAVCAGILATACASAPNSVGALTRLCSGRSTSARLRATVDTVRGPGGAALASLRGTSFELRLQLNPGAAVDPGAGAECSATSGPAYFAGNLPDAIRTAASNTLIASWRIEGDTVLLDLNPGTRDNNVFVVLPLRGGRGHWGLSTFAGEVAGGSTEPLPER